MDKKQKILELQERLDRTLAMPDLTNEESIKSLVKEQLVRSSYQGNEGNIEKVVEKRTPEVSNFLEMLRSASTKYQKAGKSPMYNEWKVKQDTDQVRVMYREGPHGTPFHTLLVEGYADGPLDVCLCVSLEATLYKKWWPQYNIPTFKITMSSCLQKVCVGEEISLVRVKVAWPVSDREALMHYFEIEYLKEDLIIILLNTISDAEQIDIDTHGFSRDGIPAAKDTVRIDMVGGIVVQKIDANRSYFRAIANMDIKLDFVPPSLINFVARQLIGNGHKLFQKAVRSVATSDEDYRQALQGPLYARIREGLYSSKNLKAASTDLNEEKHEVLSSEGDTDSDTSLSEIRPVTEIVEEQTSLGLSINQIHPTEEHMSIENSSNSPEQSLSSSLANVIQSTDGHACKETTFISPEVEHALRTLDQAIAAVRGRGFSGSNQSDCFSIIPTPAAVLNSSPLPNGNTPKDITNGGTRPSNAAEVISDAEALRNNMMDSASKERENDDQRELAVSTERTSASYTKPTAVDTATVTRPPLSESMRKVCDEDSLKANGFHGMDMNHGGKSNFSSKQGNKKKHGFTCCLNLSLFRR